MIPRPVDRLHHSVAPFTGRQPACPAVCRPMHSARWENFQPAAIPCLLLGVQIPEAIWPVAPVQPRATRVLRRTWRNPSS